MSLAPAYTLFDEITDFLVSSPLPEAIIAYQSSETLNARLQELLEKNSHDGLTLAEQEELDTFLNLGHMLTILKAKARLKLAGEA